MQEIIRNTFSGGMSSSIVDEFQNTETYKKGINVRLTSISHSRLNSPDLVGNENVGFSSSESGADYALVNTPGMLSMFEFEEGFTPIAFAEYKDIVYLMLYNNDSETVQFGSYPYFASGALVWNYKPFQNLVNDTDYEAALANEGSAVSPDPISSISALTIDNKYINVELQRPEMMVKERFDGSIDLFICNLKGPDIVINSGFNHYTGDVVLNYYTERSFQSNTHHVLNESKKIASIQLMEIQEGGNFKNGAYRFFLRYKTKDNNTSFISQSKIIPIYVKGNAGTVQGGDAETEYGCKIKLEISDIDLGQEYFELGYVYYSEKSVNQFIINKRYSVHGSLDIVVTGTEAITSVEADEFIFLKSSIKAHKTQTSINNVLIQGNGVNYKKHHQDLFDYAASVEISEDVQTIDEDDLDIDDYYNCTYHSGETYMFKLHAVFNDGSISDGYGMLGNNQEESPVFNTNGIFRFSRADVLYFWDAGNYILKRPKFNFPVVSSQWIRDNVSHWLVSRAKRNENKTYNALGLYLCNGGNGDNIGDDNDYHEDLDDGSNFNPSVSFINEKQYFPMIERKMFFMYNDEAGDKDTMMSYGFPQNGPPLGRLQAFDKETVSLQSTDILIDSYAGNLKTASYIQKLGLVSFDKSIKTGKSAVYQERECPYHFKQNGIETSIASENPNPTPFNQIEIKQADEKGDGRFISKVKDGIFNQGMLFIQDSHGSEKQTLFNMPMEAPAYIAAKVFDGYPVDSKGDSSIFIYSLFHKNPYGLNYQEMYDPFNTALYMISESIPVVTEDPYEIILGNGDCFTRRVYWKIFQGAGGLNISNFERIQMVDEGYFKDGAFTSNPLGSTFKRKLDRGYGSFVSVVLENNYNPCGRIAKGSNTFFPFDVNYEDYANRLDVVESPFYNEAFNNHLHYRSFFCYNHFTSNKQDYKNRMMWSNEQIVGLREDAWRKFPLGQNKDIEQQDGEIVRLIEDNQQLYIIQPYAVKNIPINERVPISEGLSPIIIGTPNFMSDVTSVLLKVGSRHQFSVVKGYSGFYGMSDIAKTIWFVQGGQGKMLPLSLGIEHDVNWYFENKAAGLNPDTFPFIDSTIPDNSLEGDTLFSHYDKRNNEILFNFQYGRIIAYNEKLGKFTSEFRYDPKFMFQLKDRMFSINRNGNKSQVWEHDIDKTNYQSFYGQRFESGFQIIIKKGMENKQWHAHELFITSVPLGRLAWETRNQKFNKLVEDFPFWFKPEFRNGHAYISIPRAESIQRDEGFEGLIDNQMIESVMQGQSLSFTVLIDTTKYYRCLGLNTIFNYTNA